MSQIKIDDAKQGILSNDAISSFKPGHRTRIVTIDLIRRTIFDYVIHFRMAKAHERSYATVCKAVSKEP